MTSGPFPMSPDRPEGAALPDTFEALRQLILLRHGALPKRLAQVARYAVEHPDEIAFGTAASIAEASAVQPSTLVRLAQSLGYAGFSDLQAIFRRRLASRSYQERLDVAEIAGTGSPADIAAGVLDCAAASIAKSRRSLDGAALAEAAAVLAGASTIYVLAQRRSFPAASYLGYVFAKLRMRAVVAGSPAGIDEDLLALAGPKDAAVSISFSPYAPVTLEWTRLLGAAGVPVVALTDSAFSPVVALSSVWIEIDEPDFEGFRSLSATMALSVSLAVAAAKLRRSAGG